MRRLRHLAVWELAFGFRFHLMDFRGESSQAFRGILPPSSALHENGPGIIWSPHASVRSWSSAGIRDLG
jgi:hypothetical protein